MKKRKRDACLHMEVFDNLGVPRPDEQKKERTRLEVATELIKLLEELLDMKRK